MRLIKYAVLILIALPLAFALAPGFRASAQEGGRRGSMTKPQEGGNRGNDKTPPKTIVLTSTTGSLSVVSPPGAKVTLTRARDGRTFEEVIPEGARQAIFNNLIPGQYKVAASRDGFQPRSGNVAIAASRVSPLDLTLTAIMIRVSILTNSGGGEIRYGAPGSPLDRLARVDETGKAVLDQMEVGKYEIEIVPEDISYRAHKEMIDVTSARTEFKFNLERSLSEVPFFANWNNLREWDAPASWKTVGKFLVINQPGVVLPPKEDYRYYQDMDLNAVINIKSGEAQFAVRARDKQNFYRLRIIANPDKTGELRGSLVRQGRERDLRPGSLPILTLPEGLLNRDLEVIIQAKGNRICVKIIDSQTANEFLGALDDTSGTFKIGAPGLSGAQGAQTEVKQFIARNLAPPAKTNCEAQ
jgi:hypothetical protein